MKYKVGDKVRVKQNLEEYKLYGSDVFTDGMRKYKGKIYEIEKVYVDRYRFKNADYNWTDEMLEPVKENKKECTKMKYKIGDKVRVKRNLKVNNDYSECRFCEEMDEFRGKIVTIAGMNSKKTRYIIEGLGFYFWTDEMFEDIKDNLKEPIVTYDKNLGVSFIRIGNVTICTDDYAISRKHPDDEFNEEIGQALAYKRYLEGRE